VPSNGALSVPAAGRIVVHTCPVCSTRHEISAVRAELAYGRQVSCSPECEGERRRRRRVVPLPILAA